MRRGFDAIQSFVPNPQTTVDTSSGFSSNSDVSELLENPGEMFTGYYIHSDMFINHTLV